MIILKWQIDERRHRRFKRELWAAFKIMKKCRGDLSAYRSMNSIIQKLFSCIEVELHEKENSKAAQ
jgi:hypothetical protein